MTYLRDTHLLLWLLYQPTKLPQSARTLLQPLSTDLRYSPVSFAEIAIKQRTGRLEFSVVLSEMREALHRLEIIEIPLLAPQTFCLATLPGVHKDPFDRLLVAQAQSEAMVLLTVDQMLASYGAAVRVLQ